MALFPTVVLRVLLRLCFYVVVVAVFSLFLRFPFPLYIVYVVR